MRENRKYLNELIHDVSYEAVRQSLLFDQLSNERVDAKADELAVWIWKMIDGWRDREVNALSGESLPQTGSQLKSLSEAQSEVEELEAVI